MDLVFSDCITHKPKRQHWFFGQPVSAAKPSFLRAQNMFLFNGHFASEQSKLYPPVGTRERCWGFKNQSKLGSGQLASHCLIMKQRGVGRQEMQDTFLASLSDLLRVHGHKRSKLLSAWHNDSDTSGTNLYKWYVCLNLTAQSRNQTIGQAKSQGPRVHVLFHEVPLQMDPFPCGASKKSASLQVLGPLSSQTLHHCDVIHVCGPTCSEIWYQNSSIFHNLSYQYF